MFAAKSIQISEIYEVIIYIYIYEGIIYIYWFMFNMD